MTCYFAHLYGVTECERCFARQDCHAARSMKIPGLSQASTSEPILPKDQGLQQREEE